MKDFDKAAAKRGAKVCTREGWPARILAFDLEDGDVLWQLAGLCSVMNWDLEAIARMNLDKLASRKQRGVIDGNEDNR